MGGFKDLGFAERRSAAADAKKVALERFRKHVAAPVAAVPPKARTADAAGSVTAKRAKAKKRSISRKTDTCTSTVFGDRIVSSRHGDFYDPKGGICSSSFDALGSCSSATRK